MNCLPCSHLTYSLILLLLIFCFVEAFWFGVRKIVRLLIVKTKHHFGKPCWAEEVMGDLLGLILTAVIFFKISVAETTVLTWVSKQAGFGNLFIKNLLTCCCYGYLYGKTNKTETKTIKFYSFVYMHCVLPERRFCRCEFDKQWTVEYWTCFFPLK